MSKKIMYFLTPGTHISPFDVTLAVDAGFELVLPFTKVPPNKIATMIQDAIFCRPPKRFNETGIFIGGRDVDLATDMFQNAKNAMIAPYEVGVLADPNGAYTTSASIVALIEKVLQDHTRQGLQGRQVAVLGTGPVGLCTAILATQQGATVKLCSLMADDDQRSALQFCDRYNAHVDWASAQTHEERALAIQDAEVVICAARAGIRVLDDSLLQTKNLVLVADTNAVPPSGVVGIGLHDLGAIVDHAGIRFLSIGPLAIGQLKYKTQFGLFQKIQYSNQAALIDFPDAYAFALSVLDEQTINLAEAV